MICFTTSSLEMALQKFDRITNGSIDHALLVQLGYHVHTGEVVGAVDSVLIVHRDQFISVPGVDRLFLWTGEKNFFTDNDVSFKFVDVSDLSAGYDWLEVEKVKWSPSETYVCV